MARPTAQYELVRPRHERIDVVRLDAGPVATDGGHGSSDGDNGLYAVVDERHLVVQPGAQVTSTLRVRNTGTLVERALVEVRGVPASWVSVEPAELNLDVGDDARAVVSVHPPKDARSQSGSVPITIEVSSATNPHVRCVERCRLTVGAFDAVTVTATPAASSARGRRRTPFQISIENGGNRSLDATVHVAATDGTAAAVCDRDRIVLAAGASGATTLTVRPRRPNLVGAPIVHDVRVELGGAVAAPAVVTLRQAAWVSRRTAKVLGVVLVLAMVVAGGFVRDAWAGRARAVPDVTGRAQDEAVQLLERAGFDALVEERPDDEVPADHVISQDPPAGGRDRPGSVVDLVVSTGPAALELPELYRRTQEAATEYLEGLGLQVQIERVPDPNVEAGLVVGTAPPEGAFVQPGDPVVLRISTGPPGS